jgi:hypothetical protein
VFRDVRLLFSRRDVEPVSGLPADVGVDEAVIKLVEAVVALEIQADFDLFFEESRIEAEPRTAVLLTALAALVGIDIPVLPLIAAAEFEFLKIGIPVTLIECVVTPEFVEDAGYSTPRGRCQCGQQKD